jgi:hypothetical protein
MISNQDNSRETKLNRRKEKGTSSSALFFTLCGESGTSRTGRAALASVPAEIWLALEATRSGDKAKA